jgi:hypothetical protein
MKRLDLPEEFRQLPNNIQGSGVEVFLLDSTGPFTMPAKHHLHLHTLIIILDGTISAECEGVQEILHREEAIMMKKDSIITLKIPDDTAHLFRGMVIFFDEPSLRYALMPFELQASPHGTTLLKIPLNEKIKVFTQSILLYYQSNKEKSNWSILLRNKLRELIWIFFHTDLKEQAEEFFGTTRL